jgi:general stress protein 26
VRHETVTRAELLGFMRASRFAVEASVSEEGAPQAAVIGIAVTDQFELVFDTLESTRKAQNLRRNPRIALAIGGAGDGQERTVQLEGVADEPTGGDRQRLQQVYFAQFPDDPSRLGWVGLIYVRVRPTWLRHSDFRRDPPEIVELDAAGLEKLR